jgi:ATP-dependent DNA helicase DinG
MGNVVTISDFERKPPQGQANSTGADPVLEAYDALAARLPGFRKRQDQIDLSTHIRQAVQDGVPIVAEAPTGTGKKLAYLLGALSAAREKGLPLVVATATKTLQEQIKNHDIPALERAGLIAPRKSAIAKGRANYYCPQIARMIIARAADPSALQAGLFDAAPDSDSEGGEDKVFIPEQHLALLATLTRTLEGREWSGDFDTWQGITIPPPLQEEVRCNKDTCLRKKCPVYSLCPYFKEKARVNEAELIIANHDLVLADLSLRAEKSKEKVFSFNNFVLVFDEGHHLPDKAVSHSEKSIGLRGQLDWLEQIEQLSIDLVRDATAYPLIAGGSVALSELDGMLLKSGLDEIERATRAMGLEPGKPKRQVVVAGEMPIRLKNSTGFALAEASSLETVISKMLASLRKGLKDQNLDETDTEAYNVIKLGVRLSALERRVREVRQALSAFLNEDERVRWVETSKTDVSLHASPIEGADVLRDLLWNLSLPVVIVSATLRALGNFDRYATRVGLPDNTRFHILPHTFPYQESELVFARMENPPGVTPEQKEKFAQELAARLPQDIPSKEGVLLLFNSKEAMTKVRGYLPSRLANSILWQGDGSRESLIASHKQRIDQGGGSVLAGLHSFAEGLDLPGDYCSLVLITRLPFEYPDHPVPNERKRLAEADGRNYFAEYVLPDTTVRLIQMVGRLLRRESDRGRILCYDSRLWQHNFGRKMLEDLPPFKQRHESHVTMKVVS